jgi:hypothetical protein
MRRFAEELGEFIGAEPLVEGTEYDQAKQFLAKGILPNGDRWSRGKPTLRAGFDGDIIVKRVRRKDGKKTTVFTFDIALSPGKGGGAGATIEAAASNHYFNLAGIEGVSPEADAESIKGMRKAFEEAARKSTRSLTAGLNKWFAVPDNWVWRIVGWGERNAWTKPKVKVLRIVPGKTMIDPTRRKWPSGRTEIWIPLTVTVQAEMRKKR